MKVIFGRGRGEKTLAEVIRCNPKKAKVRTLEARGDSPKGGEWGVPYAMLEEAPQDAKSARDAPEVGQTIRDKAAARRVPVDLEPGTKFRSNYADGNPEWTVVRKSGPNWLCKIMDDVDWQGTEKVFQSREILAALAMEKMFEKKAQEQDDYYASLQPGQTVHYDNGHNSFVRCEAVRDGDKMKLKPLAMVGKWDKHSLPGRNLNGDIHLPYYPKKIRDGEFFDPNASCIYENTGKGDDPRKLPNLDLTVPTMTAEEEAIADLWRVVEAAKSAVETGSDPRIRLQLTHALLHEHRHTFLS